MAIDPVVGEPVQITIQDANLGGSCEDTISFYL
jgi:hypothetical protein